MDYCSYSPDTWFGKNISVACRKHDMDYKIIWNKEPTEKNRKLRKKYDVLLRERIIELSDNHFVAWIYYIMVRLFGDIGLWKGGEQ